MKRRLGIVFLSLLAMSALRCADQARHLRVQPVWYFDVTAERAKDLSLPSLDENGNVIEQSAEPLTPMQRASLPSQTGTEGNSAKRKIAVECVRVPPKTSRKGSGMSDFPDTPQCLYISANMGSVFNLSVANRAERNQAVRLLMSISDDNCSMFLTRVFANKAGRDTLRDSGKGLATAIAAGTATVAGGLSAGVGLLNMFGGTVADSIDKVYFSEKTFQVVGAAIDTERAKVRQKITEKAEVSLIDYSYYEALQDVAKYNAACSIERGLQNLSVMANQQKEDAEKQLDDARETETEQVRQDLTTLAAQRRQVFDLQIKSREAFLAAPDKDQRKLIQEQIDALTKQLTAVESEINALNGKLQPKQTLTPPVAPKPAPVAPPAQPVAITSAG